VREGKIPSQVALKFLVPVARQSLEDCQRMASIFAEHHCDTRQAGQLYGAWRKGSPPIRKRILDDPELCFKPTEVSAGLAPATVQPPFALASARPHDCPCRDTAPDNTQPAAKEPESPPSIPWRTERR